MNNTLTKQKEFTIKKYQKLQKTLEEIIKRASDGKQRIAKMMKRDLGIEKATLMSESKKINGSKSVKLFNRCLDDVL